MQDIFVEGRERRRLFRPNDPEIIAACIGSFLLEPVMDMVFDSLPEQPLPIKRTKATPLQGLTVSRTRRTETVSGTVYGSTTSLMIYDAERKLMTMRGYSQARDEPHKLAVLRALDFFSHVSQLCWSENKTGDLGLVCLNSRAGNSPEPILVAIHGGVGDADHSELLAIEVATELLGALSEGSIDMYRPRCAVDQNISDREIKFCPKVSPGV